MPDNDNNNNEVLIEEGQDGSSSAEPSSTGPVRPIVTGTEGTFTGQLVEQNGVYFLKVQESLVRISFHANQTSPEKYTGQVITIGGRQNGFVITDAIVMEEQPVGAGGTGDFSQEADEIRREFAPVLEIIDEARLRLKNVEGIIRVRPGYKFVNGKITDTVALVVEVERKKGPASMKPREMINTIIKQIPGAKNVAVEIVQASPADIFLRKKMDELSARSADPDAHKESVALKNIVKRTEFERSLIETIVEDDGTESALFMDEAARKPYKSSSESQLELVEGAMTIECHVSPEAGWKVLKQFLSDTSDNLRIAIYDFTSPHIMKTLKSLLRAGISVKMVYHDKGAEVGKAGSNKEFDWEEEDIIEALKKAGKKNFDVIAASSKHNALFRNAYHIKVAVRDGEAFWLSSGNWQGSNQPEDFIDGSAGVQDIPDYNREWHVVIKNRKLSKIFSDFIDADYSDSEQGLEELAPLMLPDLLVPEETEEDMKEIAEAARMMQVFLPKKITFSRTNPVKVQPLLTPDNYIRHVIKLVRSAKKKLYMINQYIVPKDLSKIDPLFKELLDALKEKKNNENIDCRIILRKQGKYRQNHESMKAYKFNVDNIRWFDRCHTKGIIVDGQVVMVGSHNWSEWGVLVNRDASLIIYDAAVAKYYEDVFLHDWDRWSRDVIDEDDVPVLNDDEDVEESALLAGYKKVSWGDYFQ